MLPGIIGLVQATEAVKLILQIGEPLVGRLLMYDSLGMHFREFRTMKDPACALCGSNATITELEKWAGEVACALPLASAATPAAKAAPADAKGGCSA